MRFEFDVQFEFDDELLSAETPVDLCEYIKEWVATGKGSRDPGDPIRQGLLSDSVTVTLKDIEA